MTQYIGHLFDRAALIDQAARQSMAKRMGATVRQTNAMVGITYHAVDNVYADGLIARRQNPHEDCRVGGLGPLKANIVAPVLDQ